MLKLKITFECCVFFPQMSRTVLSTFQYSKRKRGVHKYCYVEHNYFDDNTVNQFLLWFIRILK